MEVKYGIAFTETLTGFPRITVTTVMNLGTLINQSKDYG